MAGVNTLGGRRRLVSGTISPSNPIVRTGESAGAPVSI